MNHQQSSMMLPESNHLDDMQSYRNRTHFDDFARSNFDVFGPSSFSSSANALNSLETVFNINNTYDISDEQLFEDIRNSVQSCEYTSSPQPQTPQDQSTIDCLEYISPHQPQTPQNQSTIDYFPMTPSSTPTARKSTGTAYHTNNTYNMTSKQLFEDMNSSSVQPCEYILPPQSQTPQTQSTNNFFPMTPSCTPIRRKSGIERTNQTLDDLYDHQVPTHAVNDPFVTSMKRGSSCHDSFGITELLTGTSHLPSPPNTVPRHVPTRTVKATYATPMKRGSSCQSNFDIMESFPGTSQAPNTVPRHIPTHSVKALYTTPMKRSSSFEDNFGNVEPFAGSSQPPNTVPHHISSHIVKDPFTTPMKRGSSCHDVFGITDSFGDSSRLPSPPNTVPLRSSRKFDVTPVPAPSFIDMSAFGIDFTLDNSTYDSSNYSPMTNHLSTEISSFNTSPVLAQSDLFGDLDDMLPANAWSKSQKRQRQQKAPQVTEDLTTNTSPIEQEVSNPHSILNVELDSEKDGKVEDTGFTDEDIQSWIITHSLNDFECTWDKCNKHFKRRENIKSHIQTHLGDRRFKCDECDSAFVRQHDLKRHKTIHQGDKPYKCVCPGGEFGRMDALTRHRQRGICPGALGGTPIKEPTKRGRPKKAHRPEPAERAEKAAKTRQRVLEKMKLAQSASRVPEVPISSPGTSEHLSLEREQESLMDNYGEFLNFEPSGNPMENFEWEFSDDWMNACK